MKNSDTHTTTPAPACLPVQKASTFKGHVRRTHHQRLARRASQREDVVGAATAPLTSSSPPFPSSAPLYIRDGVFRTRDVGVHWSTCSNMVVSITSHHPPPPPPPLSLSPTHHPQQLQSVAPCTAFLRRLRFSCPTPYVHPQLLTLIFSINSHFFLVSHSHDINSLMYFTLCFGKSIRLYPELIDLT